MPVFRVPPSFSQVGTRRRHACQPVPTLCQPFFVSRHAFSGVIPLLCQPCQPISYKSKLLWCGCTVNPIAVSICPTFAPHPHPHHSHLTIWEVVAQTAQTARRAAHIRFTMPTYPHRGFPPPSRRRTRFRPRLVNVEDSFIESAVSLPFRSAPVGLRRVDMISVVGV